MKSKASMPPLSHLDDGMLAPSRRLVFLLAFTTAFTLGVAGWFASITALTGAGIVGVVMVIAGGVYAALGPAEPVRARRPAREPLEPDPRDDLVPLTVVDDELPMPVDAPSPEPEAPLPWSNAPPRAPQQRAQPPRSTPRPAPVALPVASFGSAPGEPVTRTPPRYAPGFEPPVRANAAPAASPTVAPTRAARPNTTTDAPPRYSPLGGRTTRGLCSKCGTHLTLSDRRPLRATCPVCGHSRVLS